MAHDYYDGGYHFIGTDRVPVKLSFKPSKHAAEMMRGRSGTKPLRELEATRFPETTYSPIAVWNEHRCVKCGARSDDAVHNRLRYRPDAHSYAGAWRYVFSVSGVRDPRVFVEEAAAQAAAVSVLENQP